MLIKVLVILSLVGLAIYGGFNLQEDIKLYIEEDDIELFQGPVPQGYDLEHFRKIGETIKELINNG